MFFQHRRMLLLSLFALFSVFVAETLTHTAKAFFFWGLCGLSLIFLIVSLLKKRFFVFALALLLSAGAFFSSYQISYRKGIAESLAEAGAAELSVSVRTPTGNSDDVYLAEGVLTVFDEKKPVKLRVKIISPTPMQSGDVLFGEAEFLLLEENDYGASEGFYGNVCFEECRAVDRLTGLSYAVGDLRSFLIKRLHTAVPGEDGALFAALLLGNRSGLSPSFTRDMTRLGTSHMLSLSGMHLAVLTVGIAFLLKLLRLGKHLRTLILGLFVVFFMVLTGLSSSVMRAGFMFLLSALPLFLREERDSFSSLTAAVAVICLFEPYATRDLSLWLSTLATLGILFLFERMKNTKNESVSLRKRLFRAVLISLSVTVAATVATLPLTLLVFKTFPLLSPIANLLLSPLVQIALYLSLFTALLGHLPLLSWISTQICNLIFTISSILADIPRTFLPLESSYALIPVFLLFGSLLIYYLFCPKRLFRLRVPLAMCLICALTVGVIGGVPRLLHRDELKVSYFADKENRCDALLFRYKGERLMTAFSDFSFVGTAEREAFTLIAGELDGFLLPYYTENCAKYIEALVSAYKIYRLYLPTPQGTEEIEIYTDILTSAAEAGVPTVAFQADTPFFFEFLTVSHILASAEALYPAAHAEFLFGYGRIGYFSANALDEEASTCTLRADLLLFGTWGAPNNAQFPREEFISGDTRILCAAPVFLPLDNAEGIVFSVNATAYLPLRTKTP